MDEGMKFFSESRMREIRPSGSMSGTWKRSASRHRATSRLYHQIRATRGDGEVRQFDVFLNERTDTHWLSRRHPGLPRPLGEAEIAAPCGIPILSPEIQLLFKAKGTRVKDQADFELTLPRLNAVQRQWLAGALREFYPGHAWSKIID